MYRDEDFLSLSGIQHFSFCRRQWALIHIEQQWDDNLLTVQGDLMHERAHDEGLREHRGDKIIVRGLTVRSSYLGVWGKCDVVEFHKCPEGHPLAGEDGLWLPLPVEYKHGHAKANDADRLQLCVQALCLEEMLAIKIESGCLYYGATRSREYVTLGNDLRDHAMSMLREMHQLYERRYVPKAKRFTACRSCSLYEICTPASANRSASHYIDSMLRDLS